MKLLNERKFMMALGCSCAVLSGATLMGLLLCVAFYEVGSLHQWMASGAATGLALCCVLGPIVYAETNPS